MRGCTEMGLKAGPWLRELSAWLLLSKTGPLFNPSLKIREDISQDNTAFFFQVLLLEKGDENVAKQKSNRMVKK